MAQQKTANRNRFDFSKIPATIQIPNLIEVQKRSYDRFLQMDSLPSERDDAGLQAVFQSVFPITDFRNVSQLDFVEFAIGNWECKCGHLKGLNHLRTTCRNCGSTVKTDPVPPGRRALHQVRHLQRQHARLLQQVRRSGGPAAEVRRGRVRRARHDLLRAAEGHHAAHHLRQGPGDRQPLHPRHEGAGSLLRRHSADDRTTAPSSSTAPSA